MIVSSLEFARVFCYRSCSKTIDVIIELSRAFIVISLLASGDLIHLSVQGTLPCVLESDYDVKCFIVSIYRQLIGH